MFFHRSCLKRQSLRSIAALFRADGVAARQKTGLLFLLATPKIPRNRSPSDKCQQPRVLLRLVATPLSGASGMHRGEIFTCKGYKPCRHPVGWAKRAPIRMISRLRDCLGTLFRNSLTVGSLKKINNLFIKDIFHRYCLKRQSLRGCLGTHFRNSLKIGRLDKINPLF